MTPAEVDALREGCAEANYNEARKANRGGKSWPDWADIESSVRESWMSTASSKTVAWVAARVEQDRTALLNDTFLAERDLPRDLFVGIGGRRRNSDYNAGYRMAMEDAARYVRGDYTPEGKDTEANTRERLAARGENSR